MANCTTSIVLSEYITPGYASVCRFPVWFLYWSLFLTSHDPWNVIPLWRR